MNFCEPMAAMFTEIHLLFQKDIREREPCELLSIPLISKTKSIIRNEYITEAGKMFTMFTTFTDFFRSWKLAPEVREQNFDDKENP